MNLYILYKLYKCKLNTRSIMYKMLCSYKGPENKAFGSLVFSWSLTKHCCVIVIILKTDHTLQRLIPSILISMV